MPSNRTSSCHFVVAQNSMKRTPNRTNSWQREGKPRHESFIASFRLWFWFLFDLYTCLFTICRVDVYCVVHNIYLHSLYCPYSSLDIIYLFIFHHSSILLHSFVGFPFILCSLSLSFPIRFKLQEIAVNHVWHVYRMQRWLRPSCAWLASAYSASQCIAEHRWQSSCSTRCFTSAYSGSKLCKWFSLQSEHRWQHLDSWYYLSDVWRPDRRDIKCIVHGDHVSADEFPVQWWVEHSNRIHLIEWPTHSEWISNHPVCFLVVFRLQFMAITYVLNIIWTLIFCFLCIVTFVYTVFWKMCSQEDEAKPRECLIDLTQFRKLPSKWMRGSLS